MHRIGAAAIVILLTILARPTHAASVEQWSVFDLALPGPAEGNPYVDVALSADFTLGARRVHVPGFYDGEGTYRVRFSPPDVGDWTYVTHSAAPALDGKTGGVTATAPSGANHGPVRVANTFHFAYADGTRYLPFGTTCYAWTHQPDALEEQTLQTLAASPFNKLRMCVFPKSYTYNTNDPPNYPFAKQPDGTFDFARFDPANWRHLERRILDLQSLGIEADLILFHPYDRWGFAELDDAADDRYLRYAIARLSAYRNVWWSLANEYDFMIPPLRNGQKGNKSVADFDRFFSILQNEDPAGHLRSIHNASKFYDHRKPWATHASIQKRDLTQVVAWRDQFQKPIVVDEARYEGNIPNSWGNLKASEMVRQFWVGTLCGGYVGHGETLKDPNDVLWWSKGGTLHGESPARIAFLRKLVESLPFESMTPSHVESNVLVLAKPGDVYVAYAPKAGPMRLTLAGDRPYAAEAIDPWAMTTRPLDDVKPGEVTIDAPRDDYAIRLTARP